MDTISVISSDLDGRELRKEKNKNLRYLRCDGKEDNEQMQEALDGVGKYLWSIPSRRWLQIFGGK